MTKSIALIITTLLFTEAFGQRRIDSLQHLLLHSKEDTARINLMNQISLGYAESKPDSTFKYGTDALVLSRKENYRHGEINAMLNLAVPFTVAGDFPKALEYCLDALKKSEALEDKELIASCYWALGNVYFFRGDFHQGLPYAIRAKEIYEELHDETNLASMLLNAGATFIKLHHLDSSRVYLTRALEISIRQKDQDLVASINMNLGRVHTKMRQYDIAKGYLEQAIPTFVADSNYLFLYSSYYFLGEMFDSTGKYDSAFYYSRLAFVTANRLNNSPVNLVYTARQVSALFKKIGNLDSAYVYQEMAMAAKDSLTSQEQEWKLQMLTFNEQLRQMDIAEQKKKVAEVRRRNLELMSIAIFIPSFFFFVLLLGRKKVRSRTVEFLGVLSLLFVFEFIVLFTHPYIAQWTHESQIWMLLILVAIALFLVPLHHKLEKWMKEKLATKIGKNLAPHAVEIPVSRES
jgi:tetratricopeptide (TPR) repeat protein